MGNTELKKACEFIDWVNLHTHFYKSTQMQLWYDKSEFYGQKGFTTNDMYNLFIKENSTDAEIAKSESEVKSLSAEEYFNYYANEILFGSWSDLVAKCSDVAIVVHSIQAGESFASMIVEQSRRNWESELMRSDNKILHTKEEMMLFAQNAVEQAKKEWAIEKAEIIKEYQGEVDALKGSLYSKED